MSLVFHKLLEHGQLVGFLEAAQALAHGAGFRGDHDHRGMRPVCRGHGGDAVTDAGAVLANHDTVTSTDAGVTVCHVGRTLLVHHRDQADTGRGKDIHGVHERGAHDSENLGDAVGSHRFHEGFGGSHSWHC